MAGEAEIGKRGCTSLALRMDMLHNHGIARIGLLRLTIGTVMIISGNKLLPEVNRDVDRHGWGLKFISWGNCVTTPTEQRSGVGFAEHEAICFLTELD